MNTKGRNNLGAGNKGKLRIQASAGELVKSFALVLSFAGSLLGATNANALACTSAATGNWSVAATWAAPCNVVGGPVAADTVTIAAAHTVTVDVNSAATSIAVAAPSVAMHGININSGIVLSVSGAITMTAPAVNLRTSTIAVGTGTLNAGSIVIGGGTGTKISQVTVGAIGVINVTGAVTTSGTAAQSRFIATGASTITIGGNFGPGAFTPGASTLTVSGNFTPTAMVASTGTVIFAGGVTQTMRALTTYNNVTVNKSAGALSLLGTTTIGGALSVDAGTFTVDAFTLTVTGATAVSGVLGITSATGTKTFVGAVTVNPGGTWTNTTEAVTFRGGVTHNGAVFTAGTGVYTFNTTAAQSINCATALIIPSLSVTSPTVLTNNCNLTVSTALAGTGNLANAATLNIGGTSVITTLTATAAGNTVNYTGAAQTAKVTTYSNLTLSGSGAKTFASTPTVNGILSMEGAATVSVAPTYGAAATLRYNTATPRIAGVEWITPFAATGGVMIANSGAITLNASKVLNASVPLTIIGANNLITGANTLTLAASCAANGGNGSLTRTSGYVIGNLQLTFPITASTCIYHVGDSTGYAPVTVALGATTGGTLTGRVDAGDHPDTTSSGSGIDATKSANHYWTLTPGTLSSSVTYAATFQFCANTGSCTATEVDAGANTGSFNVALKSSGIWSTRISGTRNAYSTQATGITGFGEFAVGEISTNNCFSDSFTGVDGASPGTNWSVGNKTGAFGSPVIFGNRLRLTNVSTGVATWATLQRMIPAAGNKVTLVFDHFAYGGTHADGIGVILSDASVAPQAGAFGGSLGYAQKGYTPISDCTTVGGCPGFAGGWLGIGIDEYGNYSANTEGRYGGSATAIPNALALRGSGSGMSGYRFLQGTNTLSPAIDSVAVLVPPHRYRIVVDHTDGVHAWTSVERDTTGGGTAYSILLGCPPGVASGCTALDVKDPGYSQNAVPANWNLSFTGSTGAATNIHEIDNLSICTVQGLAIPTLHHIKIEHAGIACTSTPATVTVKACADATCSSLYMNNVTVSLSTTGGTWTPLSPITVTGGQATVTLTDATARTDTLAATATSPTASSATVYSPSNSLTFAACTFDVIEVGAAANTPIFTKLASSAFNLDVLKLSAGNLSVTAVALVDASSGACSTYALLANTSTALPSAFSNATPRKPFSFTYANAAPNVRVRVTTAGPNYSCSSDNFTIRPQSFAVTSSATQTGSTGTPVFRAGTDAFSLTATATSLYTGAPKFNSSLVATSLANLGTLASVAFPPAALGVSTASGFTYSEVGNFGLSQYAVYDDTFAQVDAVKGECTSNFNNGPAVGGKFGCMFGSVAAGPFGRFVPDHFTVVGGISNACAAGAFTYMGQPAPLSAANVVEARNAANGVTKNYVLPYASGIVSLGAENADDGTDLSARFTPPLAGSWILGAYTLASANATFARPATSTSDATWGSFESLDIGLKVTDGDVSTVPAVSGADMNPAAAGGSSFTYKKFAGSPLRMRFGRLKLSNAHGSELLRLPVQIQAQYWNGTGFATNTADNCTVLSAANIALGNYQRNTGDTWITSATLANTAAIAGGWHVNLSKPGPMLPSATFTGMGSVDVCVDLGSDPVGGMVCAATPANLPYLQGLWSPGTAYDNDPAARATFGVYKGNNEFIYLRESY